MRGELDFFGSLKSRVALLKGEGERGAWVPGGLGRELFGWFLGWLGGG